MLLFYYLFFYFFILYICISEYIADDIVEKLAALSRGPSASFLFKMFTGRF